MTGDEYPKWILGGRCIVPDAATEAAVLAGQVAIPTPIRSATGEHLAIVPSVGPDFAPPQVDAPVTASTET